jgi:tRNA threonylcarbamoyladenosine dehydratase
MSAQPAPVPDARFAAIDRLYGPGALAILAGMHVAVVGLGGVGSWAAEALARSGIGGLTLIDGDEVCVSNVNRQSHALDGAFGRGKVEVIAERVRAIDPHCRVRALQRFVTPDSVPAFFDEPYDYVFDACDALQVKIDMTAFCRRRKTPIIVCGSAGGRVDPTRIVVRDLAKTEQDVLLAKVRRGLRDEYGWTRNPDRYFGVLAVYSMEPARFVQADGRMGCVKPQDAEQAFRIECGGGLGSAMHVTAAFGLVAVGRIIERLLERARGLRPR